MGKRAVIFLLVTSVVTLQVSAQVGLGTHFVELGQDQASNKSLQSALGVYKIWRDETLRSYALGASTPHYAIAIVAERLDDSTAQIEVLIAAEMKQYTVTIKPVTLNRLPSGETESRAAGNAVTIDQKAGDKFGTGSDKIRIGRTTTLVTVSRAVQALEITWLPKNDKADDPSNTCIIRLSKEPEVMVNGYVIGSPVR